MAVISYVIKAIRCDHPECDEEWEGLAGESVGVVRMAARKAGWRVTSTGDRCPRHAEPDWG